MSAFLPYPIGFLTAALLAGATFADQPSTAPINPFTGRWAWSCDFRPGTNVLLPADLVQDGDQLKGVVWNYRDNSKFEIQKGSVNGMAIQFDIAEEVSGHRVVWSYSGKLADGKIKGKVKRLWDHNSEEQDWDAVPIPKPANVFAVEWAWTVDFTPGLVVALRGKFVRDGDKLKGFIESPDGSSAVEIHNGSVSGTTIQFDISDQNDDHVKWSYTGKLVDGLIKGKIKIGEGEKEWVAFPMATITKGDHRDK